MPFAQVTALPLVPSAWQVAVSHHPRREPVAPDLSPVGDQTLMQRWRDGDLKAFETLYGRHRAALHRYLLRMAPTPAEAEEIFQDTWMAVVKARATWQPHAAFRTFLFSIANRRMADGLRSRARRFAEIFAKPVEGEGAPDIASPELDPEAGAQNNDLGRALLAAISALPAPQRQAFLLQTEGGLSLEDIAEATGVPRETVKSRLRYASNRLRAELGEWLHG
jgi:RNA polymerase sigma-70 factor (ECF subfamily)